ncbi:voltage-gated potassium channel [Candidatus Methanophagaceae archaeon]|nr:voltage-gated potassium channel [Methanophagales archaeon]
MLIRLINKLRALRRHVDKFRILFILIFVIIFGSIAFSYFEKKGIWDAVYWVIVTVTTVGYGDFYPETTGGRITFVLVALGGIGTIAYVIEQLVSFSTKSALKKLFGTGAVKMKQHTIIVGWNTKAEEAVKELKSVNEVFLVVGSELDHTELDAQEIPHISGDPTKSETLNRCGIEDAKTLMIPLENDSETIMIALATRKLNPGIKIVATCEAREHVEMMRGAGIDHIISYAEISGRLLAHAVTEPVVVNFIMDASTSVEGFDLKQIKVGEKTKLSEISLKENERVIALYESGRFVFDFTADVMLEEGDYLVVISSSR